MCPVCSLFYTLTDKVVLLQVPKFDFVSNTKPSLFAYPPATKLPEKQQAEKVQTAVLSTTAKSTARAKEKEKERAAADGMQTVSCDLPKSL